MTDGESVVERDLDQHVTDRRTQRKGKVATEFVKSITSQIQKKQQKKGQSVENNQNMNEISRSKQASPQKSQPATEIRKSKDKRAQEIKQ